MPSQKGKEEKLSSRPGKFQLLTSPFFSLLLFPFSRIPFIVFSRLPFFSPLSFFPFIFVYLSHEPLVLQAENIFPLVYKGRTTEVSLILMPLVAQPSAFDAERTPMISSRLFFSFSFSLSFQFHLSEFHSRRKQLRYAWNFLVRWVGCKFRKVE